MPDLIIIRLHPVEPTDGVSFATYLANLKITVLERRFSNPSGAGNVVGTAAHDPNPAVSRIFQHLAPPLLPAATAVVVITAAPGYPEYLSTDLVLQVERGGKKILDQRIHYNVDVLKSVPIPPGNPLVYAALGPVGLYLPLPDPKIGLDPSLAYVEMPTDGTPPNFNALRAAVLKVLAKDPGGAPPDLGALTPDQCVHIAREIINNRALEPLPAPPTPLTLADLYAPGSPPPHDNERRKFEADLTTYYTVHGARADVLAKFIFSMSAAEACAKKSQIADRVGFRFPVLPGLPVNGDKIAEATVVLSK
jgi:hypothetical protein